MHCMYGLYVIQKLVGPGRALKFHQPEKKMSCAQREIFYCYGDSQKSYGVACSGVEIPCSGVGNGG